MHYPKVLRMTWNFCTLFRRVKLTYKQNQNRFGQFLSDLQNFEFSEL